MTYQEYRTIVLEWLEKEGRDNHELAATMDSVEAAKYFEGKADMAAAAYNLIRDLYVQETPKACTLNAAMETNEAYAVALLKIATYPPFAAAPPSQVLDELRDTARAALRNRLQER